MMHNHSLDVFRDMPGFIRDFIRHLVDNRLNLYASEVFDILDFRTESQFEQTLEKVLDVLHKAGIPAEHHIRPVFAGYRSQAVIDYKMSPLAFGLMCMHAEPVTEHIARLQVEWLAKAVR